ncbi:MAG TPA: D-2-hydroxyacid dehydrogenase [Thermomicrobiales bacterium]
MAARELRLLLIGAELSESQLARLRERFPDIEFVVATGEEFDRRLPEADAVLNWRLTPEQVARATRLRWLQTVGAGVDDILHPELIQRGILITNNSGVHATNISEHILAMMLAFARRLPFLMRGQVAHEWRDEDGRRGVFELDGQTLLVVGTGDIGQALAQRASALGMTVLGVRRRPGQGSVPGCAEVAGIEQLPAMLGRADHVAICLPLTRETHGLFNRETIAAMRPGSYLYNIGRGPIVETQALIEALQSGHLAGAGLDVTDPEPLPPDSPLWDMENVIITAHTSGATPRYWDRAVEILSANIERFRAGQDLINLVDPEAGY